MEEAVVIHQRGRDEMYKLWHEARHNELIYIHTGNGDIVFRDRMYPLKRGVLCYIEAGTIHYTMPRDVRSYDRSKLFYTAELRTNTLAGPISRACEGLGRVVYAEIPPEQQERVEQILAMADCADNFGGHAPLLCCTCFLQLLVFLEKYKLDNVHADKDPIAEAIAYIHRHLNTPLTLDEICGRLHISKYYFCALFKKTTGLSVMQYILDTRITAAKALLPGTAPIGEISAQCGFSSFSYFSRVFREQTGMTPRAYRLMMRGRA